MTGLSTPDWTGIHLSLSFVAHDRHCKSPTTRQYCGTWLLPSRPFPFPFPPQQLHLQVRGELQESIVPLPSPHLVSLPIRLLPALSVPSSCLATLHLLSYACIPRVLIACSYLIWTLGLRLTDASSRTDHFRKCCNDTRNHITPSVLSLAPCATRLTKTCHLDGEPRAPKLEVSPIPRPSVTAFVIATRVLVTAGQHCRASPTHLDLVTATSQNAICERLNIWISPRFTHGLRPVRNQSISQPTSLSAVPWTRWHSTNPHDLPFKGHPGSR